LHQLHFASSLFYFLSLGSAIRVGIAPRVDDDGEPNHSMFLRPTQIVIMSTTTRHRSDRWLQSVRAFIRRKVAWMVTFLVNLRLGKDLE
jgi:hypothetical protein